MATFSIREFSDELAADFDAINRAWITTMFVVEPHDDQVLSHPREMIVDRGGTILFVADAQGRVLGAGALMLTGGGAIELTKMGVRDAARGSGAGRFLLDALIERARTLAPTPLYLLTSRKCSAAIHLYEQAGFVHDPRIMGRFGGDYARCDVAMSFPLD
jgi:GNAT superfamily N-acetyltransferase